MSIHVRTDWKGDLQEHGTARFEKASISLAIPREFGGSGEGLGPKDLYLSSAAACFLMSLKVTLHHSKIRTHLLQIESIFSSEGDNLMITHQVHVAVATVEERNKLPKLIHLADKNCLIGSLAKKAGVEVVVEPVITCMGD